MRKLQVITVVLFIALVSLGLSIASQRPLWNDEYYSLVSSTLLTSYKSIIMGHIIEGNNSPLFYILQKVQCDLFSYHVTHEWMIGHWGDSQFYDQFFLRIQSVVFMSMALCALFYYFSRRHSWAMGVYALAVFTTSSLFWFHWTEARPYAAWMSLSLFQILILLNILEGPINQFKRNLACLILAHCLLALTTSESIIQIMATGVVLWIYHRPSNFLYVPLALAPVGICSFYYIHASHFPLFFVDGPVALISANIPKERLLFIFMTAALLVVQCRNKKWMKRLEIKYLAFFVLLLGAFGLLLLKLEYSQVVVGYKGFQVSSRYFLPLIPAGVVGTVLFSEYLIQAFPSRVWKASAIIILTFFLVFRFQKTLQLTAKNELPRGLLISS